MIPKDPVYRKRETPRPFPDTQFAKRQLLDTTSKAGRAAQRASDHLVKAHALVLTDQFADADALIDQATSILRGES